jgi:hypothetical protein
VILARGAATGWVGIRRNQRIRGHGCKEQSAPAAIIIGSICSVGGVRGFSPKLPFSSESLSARSHSWPRHGPYGANDKLDARTSRLIAVNAAASAGAVNCQNVAVTVGGIGIVATRRVGWRLARLLRADPNPSTTAEVTTGIH